MDTNYHYYAFISYSHKDAKWAKWIQDAVEHYKLPAIIRKEAKEPLPKKLSPVFRDATHLGAGKLVNNLHSELEASKFLIVVCSPSAAKPNAEGKQFVDSEVWHFCELGRSDRIIPVIVEGTPETSFCPKIKEEEILALDATKFPKARILNDIVARLLGLRPDDLWKRERRRKRHKRAVYCGLTMLLALLFMGLASIFKDRYCDYVKYYSDYINEWGIPQGIGELTQAEKDHRSRYYKFVYRGYARQGDGQQQRILRSVSYCDATGYIADDAPCIWVQRPPRQDFYYENGTLIRKTATDENGMEMYSLNISEEGIWSKSSNNPHDPTWIWGGTGLSPFFIEGRETP